MTVSAPDAVNVLPIVAVLDVVSVPALRPPVHVDGAATVLAPTQTDVVPVSVVMIVLNAPGRS
jgi:hypothetical protein